MNRTQIANQSNFFLKCEFILCFFIILFTVTKFSNLVSLCFILSFIVLFAFLIHTVLGHELTKKEVFNFMLLTAIVTVSFVAILQNTSSASLSFGYYKKYFMFCSTVVFLFIVSKMTINKKTINFILALNILISCMYIYRYFFREREYFSGGLTFNFSNPNFTAMWILQTFLYVFIAMLYYRKNIMRVLCVVILTFLSYFLFETRARSALIAVVVFAVLALYVSMKRNIKINKSIVTVLVLSPIIAALVYFILIQSGSIQKFNFLESAGKSLYSRQEIWTNAFDTIKAFPITGDYYQISGGTGQSQMHNTHIDVWASYGTIVFVMLMVYMIRIVIRISAGCATKFQTIALMAFFTVIAMGMGEAALFSGGTGIYILSCSFLLLARYDFDNIQKIKPKENHSNFKYTQIRAIR